MALDILTYGQAMAGPSGTLGERPGSWSCVCSWSNSRVAPKGHGSVPKTSRRNGAGPHEKWRKSGGAAPATQDSITSTCSDCCIRGENAGGLSWTVKCVRSQSTSLHQNVAQALPNCKEGELYIMRKLRLRGVEDSRSPRSDRLCSLHLCRSIVLFCSLPGLSSEAQNKHAYPLLDPSFS
ncbi:uncharacterized protein LOC118919346 isoform X4 [Manis pentadactyla]|uniref:uncharacterized protein LOC118919346 isoform X4 n=1 Tax=Manis pentadactyla TaxID=143292 RepID=UPI00255CB94C|nr:uncharacterized protein LOC118919346 isoform X4 [Manis pentadactyla]